MVKIRIVFILFLGLLSLPAFSEGREDCLSALQKLNHLIESNHFETRRGFSHYVRTFPQSFSETLAQLGPDEHWVDAGSGEGFAIEDFFKREAIEETLLMKGARAGYFQYQTEVITKAQAQFILAAFNSKGLEQKPRVTGVTFVMERNPPAQPKLNFYTGRFFEEIAESELGSAALISDFYGVVSYSPNLSQVIQRYHQILKTGGKAYILVGDFVERPQVGAVGWDAPLANSRVKKANGTEVSLLDWLKSLKGFSASVEAREMAPRYSVGSTTGGIRRYSLILEKTQESLEIPHLRLMDSDLGKPPVRIFEELSQ